ncbi:RDD family protein [Streptomonospora sp. PA3]|uniref:RDD family protein n=1 Tax=Streptomonospora sp. PA3 TaxID=2607326 RepID=UPI0012DDDE1F|nr:RDD family protein [Streptomonospora sp. PA3]MUL41183.1 RDD family protein [Streptomonospora sp. PA3]
MSNPYGNQPYPPEYGSGGHTPPGQGHPPGFAPPPPPAPYGAPAGPGLGPGSPYGHPAAPVFPPTASWGARAGAFLIDWFISVVVFLVLLYGPMFLLIWLLDPDNSDAGETAVIFSMPVIMLIAAFAAFAYFWIPHGRSGMTPGKRVFGLKVILMKTGEAPPMGLAAGRQLVALALATVGCVGFLVDMLWPLWDEPYGQAVHDKAVGTRVINVRAAGAGPQAAAPAAPPPGTGGFY